MPARRIVWFLGLGCVVFATAAAAAPGLSLRDFLRQRNDRLDDITAGQIAKMKALIAATPDDDPQRPDFLFRLGEHCGDKRRSFSNRARALDQVIFDAPAAQKEMLRAQQRELEAGEQTWLLEAVASYVAATKFPRYGRMDEVLFRLADLLLSIKKDEEARAFLRRLLKDHPSSRYVPDAYLVFAERAFEKGEMNEALRFYDKVAQFPASSVYPYAVYKTGWCQVNLGDFKAALETFVAVVRFAEGQRPGGDQAHRQLLIKEARRDIVTAYARVAGPDKAWDFFRRTGGDSARAMLEALAERYWEQGQASDSSRVYRKMMAETPTSARLCEWQGKVLRNTLSAGDKREQTRELERLGAVYTGKPPQVRDRAAECRTAFHDATRELALVWHREAQKTQNTDTYRLAERAYRLFLTHFPDDADGYDMNYYLGELLWSLKRWKDAAEQYTQVVAMNARGKYLRDAAHAAVLAWKNALADGDSTGAPHTGDGDRAPRPIPEDESKMLAALRAYRQYVPDAPELPAVVYREAYILYDHNHCAEAAPLFLQVAQTQAAVELAPVAANLFLDCLNALGKTAEVVSWVHVFLDTAHLMRDTAFAAQMISLLSDAYDAEGRAHEARRDDKECGRLFVAAAEAAPEHRKHAERLWNAGQCFQNAHLVGQAVKAWQALIKSHPGDALARRAIFRLGAGYHQLALYNLAADQYEEFAKKYPGEPQAVAALGNAVTFREGLGDRKAALADMDAFVRFYGERTPPSAAAVYFQKAEVFEESQDFERLQAHLTSYLASWARHGGRDREVLAHFRLGELAWRASCPHVSEDGACLRLERLDATRGRQLVSSARRQARKGRGTRQCGPATRAIVAIFARNKSAAAVAEAHFRSAIKLWKTGDAGNPITGAEAEARKARAAHAIAGATFYLAEKDYEEFLRLEFPANLDFSRPSGGADPRQRALTARRLDESKRRFAAYMTEKTRRLQAARAQYQEAFKMRQAHWTIAAAARIGQLHQHFAGQLYTAEIPRDLPDVDRWGNRPRDLYCDRLEDEAGKIEATAVTALRACLTAATQQSWYNAWSRLCERELNQLEPAAYPLSAEVKPEPGQHPMMLSAVPVIPTLADEIR